MNSFLLQRTTRDRNSMPNSFSYIVLYSWPIVVIFLFLRLPLNAAIAWSIVGGYLFLPLRAGFNLPLLPTIDKTAIPSLAALFMCVVVSGRLRQQVTRNILVADKVGGVSNAIADVAPRHCTRQLSSKPPRRPAILVLFALAGLMFSSPIITALNNDESLLIGFRILPALTMYDAFSMILSLIIMTIPFFLAERYLFSEESHVMLLKVIGIASLVYSVAVLWEVRMSPQLNLSIYGFMQHSFLQQMRYDGFRSIVFLQHGLWVALFIAMSVISLSATWRIKKESKNRPTVWLYATFYMFGVLILQKSFGAIIIVMLLLPCTLLFSARWQMLVASFFSILILLYPLARIVDFIPTNEVYNYVNTIDPERAQSLQVRLVNEEELLAKAWDKPFFGWGGWGRNRITDELTGDDLSITDSMWIIIVGTYGVVGYTAQFGLLCLPVCLIAFRSNKIGLATAGLSIVLAVNLFDLIANATMTPVTWVIAGALMGRYTRASENC